MDAYNLERLNFRVVEDNGHMRSVVRSVLRAPGARHVEEAADGADGLTAAEAETPLEE